MNCTCSILSPFRWRDSCRPSIFVGASGFHAASTTGMSSQQTSTAAAMQYEQKHGRSLGTLGGISEKADAAAEEHRSRRAARS